MSDLIERQAAIDAVGSMLRRKFGIGGDLAEITLAGLPSAQADVHDTNVGDTISRQAAIEIVDFECGEWRGLAKTITERLSGLPPAQPDISAYSDKLWKRAYERGKAEAQPDLDEVYAHAETEAEARYHAEIIACGDCKHWICHDRRWVIGITESEQLIGVVMQKGETMSDLISAQESVTKIVDTAIRKIMSGEQKLTKEYEQSVIDAVDVILNTARCEIIQCKDCKHQVKEWRTDKRLKDNGYIVC